MNKQLMSKIFKKAHALAKSIRKSGDSYRDTFALCLKFVRSSAETVADVLTAEMPGEMYAMAWVKGQHSRVYVKQYGRRGDHGFIDMNSQRGTLSWNAADIVAPILARYGIRGVGLSAIAAV